MAVKQERIGFYGKFTPTSLDTSGADKMRALAGLGETVADTALAIGKPIAVKEGAKKGAIAGSKTGRVDPATGELIAPPEQRKFGYSANAFNDAAENAYIGNVSFELDQSVNSAQEQFPDDIIGYSKLVDASKQGLLSKMPEQYRGSAELVFDKLNAKAASSVAKAEKAKDLALTTAGIEQGAVVLSDIVTNDAYAGNVDDAEEGLAEFTAATLSLVENAGLDPSIALQRINNLTDRITVQAKLGEVNRAVLDDAYPIEDRAVNGRAIVEALRDNPDQTLSAEQNQELLNRLDIRVAGFEKQIAEDAAKLTIEQQNAKATFNTAVGLSLFSDEELTAMAYNLKEQNILTPDQTSEYIIKINKKSDSDIKKAQVNQQIADMISPQGIEAREDGTAKNSTGFLGPVKRDDGSVMTEFSVGVEINGKETLIPSMVPTLTDEEVETLRTLPEGENIPKQILIKASDHAKQRMQAGFSPFYEDPVFTPTPEEVNTYYSENTAPSLPTDLQARSAYQAQFVDSMNQVPALMRTEIRNALNSANPDDIAYAIDTIDRIQSIPGIGENAFSDSEIAFASQVSNADDYLPLPEAIANAKAITGTGSPAQKAMSEARLLEIKSKDNKKIWGTEVYAEEVTDQMTGLFFDSKTNFQKEFAFDQLVSDYGKLTENLYRAGMVDVESAKAKAMKLMVANWSRGEFGLIKYSPEKFEGYKLKKTGDTSYIRDELFNSLQADGINVQRENIFLNSDDETARTAASGFPTYGVMIIADDGTLQSIEALDQNGNMSGRFKPDVAEGNRLQAARIKAEEEGKMNKYGTLNERKIKAAKIAEKFGTDNPLKQAEREAMRAVLKSSKSPFALVGKGIEGFKNIPDAITVENIKKVLLATGMPQLTTKVGEAANFIVEEIGRSSDEYVASLSRKGK